MPDHVHIRTFKPEELFIDGDDVKILLKFFFQGEDSYFDEVVLDDRLIGFTQGLLVEAVDKSYAMGFIKILFGATYLKPPTVVVK